MPDAPSPTAYRSYSRFLPKRVRSLLVHPRVQPKVVAVLRSRVVRESPAFAARELSGRHIESVYRVRESGLRAVVVHGTADAHSLDQAYYARAHEPPEAVLKVLRELDHPPRALDLGANIGIWGLWFHGRFPGAHVVALEPDPENVARHRRQAELNGLESSWEVIEAAAVRSDGPVSFTVGKATNGRVSESESEDTASVPGRDTFALLEDLDLLKIDIEGGEWAILADPRAAELAVPVVMLEYHAHGAPGDPEVAARAALERAGYTVEATVHSAEGFGVVWGWKSACASA
jgi:FkbM family methyltransferase